MKTALAIAASLMVLLPTMFRVLPPAESTETQFEKYIMEFRKSYFSRDEYSFRLGVFQENL